MSICAEIPTTSQGNSLQQPKASPDPRPDPYYIRTIVYPRPYGIWRRPRTRAAAEVVSDCVTQWFQYTLKEAKAGDIAMQVLVGRMYYSGYGVPRDAHKGRTWIGRAFRNSVWKVGNKHPGFYNASDSDSDDTKEDVKENRC
ncbi:uncharacterized protein [Primulina huaijiensis]|uniref:uncharacterized protein isoform X2 n=1 Tax=Primulina huaijiensis TaxID=1492673 RepID=UPI003CC6FE7C